MGIFSSSKTPTRLKRARQTAAQQATRDAQGRFAKKHFFEHVFDSIERAVTGVKRVHRKVKQVQRTMKRAAKAQPRMTNATPKRRTRARKKRSAASGRIPDYRKRVVRGMFQ